MVELRFVIRIDYIDMNTANEDEWWDADYEEEEFYFYIISFILYSILCYIL